MTREEARKQLEGTWSFQMSGNAVLVHEESLLREISLLTEAARQFPVTAGRRHAIVDYASALHILGG